VTSSSGPILAFPSVAELTSAPLSPIRLNGDMIDVWSGSLKAHTTVQQRCHAWLSEDERTRAARFLRPKDQIIFTLARGGLRAVLARYVGVEPGDIQITVGPNGKPRLSDQQGGPEVLRFNLSHAHGRMLISVAKGREVGIDLEPILDNREPLKLAKRFYTTAEYQWIMSRPPRDQAAEFFRLWVAKEACVKAQGTGLASLQHCDILASSSSIRASVRLPSTSAIEQGWAIQWLNCGLGWQGAVSACGNDWSIRVQDAIKV
jgi:4'-phosphopantetheinyl transferase